MITSINRQRKNKPLKSNRLHRKVSENIHISTDKVVEFVKADSELASQVNKTYALIKETERPKYIPAQIVKTIQSEGYPKFRMHEHTQLWRAKDGKNPNKGFGVKVANSWYWYEAWLEEVRKHCSENRNQYS